MKNFAVFLFSIFTVFAFSQNASAEKWSLTANYSNTNGLGLTEVRGVSEQGAAISVKDADGQGLLCLPLFGVVGDNGEYSCFGLNVVPPVSVTAATRFFGAIEKDSTTVAQEINENSSAWMLEVEPVTSLFGFTTVKGVSEQGASVAAVDSTDKKLFCMPLLGMIGENGEFSCFGFGITPPVSVTVKSSLFSLLSGRADATVTVNKKS